MKERRRNFAMLVVLAAGAAVAQEIPEPQLKPGDARPANPLEATTGPQQIQLHLPVGTPIQVALPKELRVRKVGQAIEGRVVEPVYAFDQIVVPVGASVEGRISELGKLSGKQRTLSALNADFTPPRDVGVNFDAMVLPNGKRMPIETSVTPGSGRVLQFVTGAEPDKKKGVKDEAAEKTKEAKAQAKQQWDQAMQQIHTPGRAHRLVRWSQKLLPARPQYVPAGTVYFAELKTPLEFGQEMMTPEMAQSLGAKVPEGSLVRARLLTPLTSASAQVGDAVDAVVSRPVFDGKALILPQGSHLKGTVLQVHPAGLWKKNGQLRLTFKELVPPEGVEQQVEATLAAVQAGKHANVKLDSEGGAEATTSKTRYLSTAVSLALAAASAHQDPDEPAVGSPGARAAGGLNGFKLVGMTMGFLVKSRAFGYAMGAYGAANSVYSNFIARGQEVVFPKDTAMEVALAKRVGATTAVSPGREAGK
jgi:type IV secretory pathway VirB10-like protein